MRYIDEVCNLFDCEVLYDIEETEQGMVNTAVSIGSRAEHAAGLIGFIMTPWFHTLDELNAFCCLHIEKFREIGEKEDEPAPDATDWLIPTPLPELTMKPNPLFKS
jgi:hypothetical protein